MFVINDFFTKKHFLEIIEKESIELKSPSLCSKKDLKDFLQHYIVDRKLTYKYKYLTFIENKNLNSNDKNNVMLIAKQINSFISNGYDFERSFYNNIDEIILDAEKIKHYTSYSSIGKAVRNLNVYLQLQKKEKINYEKTFDIKEEIKRNSINKFKHKTGEFVVDFM